MWAPSCGRLKLAEAPDQDRRERATLNRRVEARPSVRCFHAPFSLLAKSWRLRDAKAFRWMP